jgi:hypothetical protein
MLMLNENVPPSAQFVCLFVFVFVYYLEIPNYKRPKSPEAPHASQCASWYNFNLPIQTHLRCAGKDKG